MYSSVYYECIVDRAVRAYLDRIAQKFLRIILRCARAFLIPLIM